MKKNITLYILSLVFALATYVMEAALIRSFYIGNLNPIIIHGAAYILLFAGFSTVSAISARNCGSVAKWVVAVSIVVYFLLSLFLVGFHLYKAAMITGMILLAMPCWYTSKGRSIHIATISVGCTVIGLFAVAIPGYYYQEIEIMIREKTAPLNISAENGYFAHAKEAEKLYFFKPELTSTADVLLHKSMQAYVCANYTDQVIYWGARDGDTLYTDHHVSMIKKYYPAVEIVEIDNEKALLDIYADRIQNYILYDAADEQSMFTAINLCNQMKAVMVDVTRENVAVEYGWSRVFDTRGWNEDRLIASEYFDRLNLSILYLIENDYVDLSLMYDNAILNNAWVAINDQTMRQFENRLKRLERNSIAIGSINKLSENGAVTAAARYGVTFIYGSSTSNLSVLSGFRLESAANSDVVAEGKVHKKTELYNDDDNPKHTVCIMLSDADNIRFCSEQGLVTNRYYGSPRRNEDLHVNIGLSGAMVEIAPILLLSYYDKMYPSEDFAYQLSSIGYTYPTKWTDKEAWAQVVSSLTRLMKVTDTRVLEIMDDTAFMELINVNASFDGLKKYYDTFTADENVDGCLFIDFMELYAGYEGEICWSNDKPVVSARYSVWNDNSDFHTEKNEIDTIVELVNSASRDVHSEDAYTFIIVHAWSGLDENGKLVQAGDNMAIFEQLENGFADDVEVVGSTEFIRRLKKYVDHK